MTPLWLIAALCIGLGLAPQLLTRSAAGDRLFDDLPWADKAVRIGAIGTFCILVFVYFMNSKA
ncbi:MAG: hypothetical protein V4564_19230 [Pseudomonadota bacterium]|uniref:hypothetical protein n=1 Tax=Sphingomonas sp. ERG5 TaxID=1381597 RepID=UPI00126A400A|nr:hypothetical protein [Sphingomonas sp. ERG5]